MGYKFPKYSEVVFYKNGNFKKCKVSKDMQIYGREYSGGSTACFSIDGKAIPCSYLKE